MTGRAATVALAVLASLLAGACSGGGSSSGASGASPASVASSSGAPTSGATPSSLAPGPPASVPAGDPAKAIAAVDGIVITEASFNAELNALGSVPAYLDATDLVLTPGSGTRLPQGGFDPGYVRNLLRRRILLTLVEHELQVRGITVSDVCHATAVARLPAALAGGDTEQGQTFLDAFPAAYRDQLVTWNAELKQLQATLSGLPCDTTATGAQDTIGTAYATWLDATLATATISVDPAYGAWDLSSGTILPPGGPGVLQPSTSSGG